jgi:uncharacterized membrane protein
MQDAQTDDAPVATAKNDQSPAGTSMVGRAVTIRRPVGEVYGYFREFSNLPTFMENVERVEQLGGGRSHWVVKAPAGATVEWHARLTEEVENEVLAWETEEGADVPNAGRVTFRDAGERGTVVTATISYEPPAGFIGKVVAKMFQREPAIQARRDLRRFKQLMETGEIATNATTRQQLEKEGR